MGLGVGVIVLLPTTIRGMAADGNAIFGAMLVVSDAEAETGTDC